MKTAAMKTASMKIAATKTADAPFRSEASLEASAISSAHPRAWEVTVHDSIEPLAEHWRALEADGCCSVFQSYDWLSVWYEVTARHGLAQTLIVTARRNGAEAPEVILPLCRLRRRGHFEVTFPDILVGDFAGPLFRKDAFEEPDAMQTLWEAILRALPACDVVHLTKIAPMIGGLPNPLVDLSGAVEFPSRVWGLPLQPGSGVVPDLVPEAVLASANKRRVALERKHGRIVTWTEDVERLPALYEELVGLRTERSGRIQRNEALHIPAWREFYAILAARQHERLRPIIVRIEIEGQTIATFFGVGYGGALHYLLPTFVMKKWSRYTPGFQLIVDAMEMSSARGYDYFDFTIGDEPYKEAFGARPASLYEIMAPTSLRGRIPYVIWLLKLRLRRHPRLQGILRRLLRR
jgi:CelD/BcsL family acetyltransferase involved in cellulose biosynthesis